MADMKLLIPIISKWEGGYVNDPNDRGGETNKGVTLATWKAAGYDTSEKIPVVTVSVYGKPKTYRNVTKSLYEMTEDQWIGIMKPMYWDKWKADEIENQSIANLLVDWIWASGIYGIKYPQQVLRVTADGIVGPKTLNTVNNYPNQHELFNKLWLRRKEHFESIVRNNPDQRKFLQGWLNRLNDFKFKP